MLGKRAVSADTAVRLARHFGTLERFWLGLRDHHRLEEARRDGPYTAEATGA